MDKAMKQDFPARSPVEPMKRTDSEDNNHGNDRLRGCVCVWGGGSGDLKVEPLVASDRGLGGFGH